MVIDHVRKNSAYIESLDCETVASKMTEAENYSKEDVLDTLVKEEIREYTWSVVDRIPLKFRELILMRYLQDLKYDEIAEITQMPVGTVKNRLFKAKEMLKMELEKDGVLT
jgi:RNA polymerase sigma-70 factor (ECF subfamily)